MIEASKNTGFTWFCDPKGVENNIKRCFQELLITYINGMASLKEELSFGKKI